MMLHRAARHIPSLSIRERLARLREFAELRVVRSFVRENEIWLAVLAAIVGIAAGLMVSGMTAVTRQLHHLLFAIPGDELSGAEFVDPVRIVLVPIGGGLLMGLIGYVLARRGRTAIVDPVEANALHGGRMSLAGSLVVVLQTMVSNGCGASVGMEAGYTQIGSAVASKLGRLLRVRRSDLRTLVGCGAAGAIAAAFDAPLTGAFYAFELIIATYSIANLAPVVIASIAAVGTMRLVSSPISFQVGFAGNLSAADYSLVMLMGVLSALLGIAVMRGVTVVEAVFRQSSMPVWFRPAIGGSVVGLFGLVTPAVLSSGHSALHIGFDAYYSAGFLALLIVLKTLASAVSIGSGFRGGLFFAALFLGAMLGKLVAIGWMLVFGLDIPAVVVGIIGMSAMATAVLGGPLTMSFLALETTGSLPLTIGVLAASVISSITVRRVFGYSFTTWRFHLRGESIRSAADVGWIRDLSVGRMMRRDVRTVKSDLTIEQFRRQFPLGATQRVIVVDRADRYAGIVLVPEVYQAGLTATTIDEVLHYQTNILLPEMNVRDAAALFAKAESDALAVVTNRDERKVIGQLTEQHVLRRYAEELDRQSRELSGA
jgi:chloride channel protein, CIC family